MAQHGGFEHNLQSLRVVDELEERYGAFNGLNLTFEAREGILKHCSLENARKLGELGSALHRAAPAVTRGGRSPTWQTKSRTTITMSMMGSLRAAAVGAARRDFVVRAARRRGAQAVPAVVERRMIHETVRRMINALIVDLVHESSRRIEAAYLKTIDDVRGGACWSHFQSRCDVKQTR